MFRRAQQTIVGVATGIVLTVAGLFFARTANLFDDTEQQLRQELSAREKQNRVLAEMIERLSSSRRVAQIFVNDQQLDDAGDVISTQLIFQEVNEDAGGPTALPAKTITVPGDFAWFDALVIRFRDQFVAEGDALRGHSLHLFRRVFSDRLAPEKGTLLEPLANGVPARFVVPPTSAPAGVTPNETMAFQRNLWQRFWEYSRNPQAAEQVGVDVAFAQAVGAPLRENDLWELTLEADGGLAIRRQPLASELINAIRTRYEAATQPAQ